MAKYQIVGVQRKKGSYEGHEYDNTYLHVLGKNLNVSGMMCDTIKMKTAMYNSVLLENGIGDTDIVGRAADISFDKYRNVESVELFEAPKK